MIVLFTDGACSGNPGPGGWACVLALPDGRARELSGREEATTNNRMELRAVIEGLLSVRALPGRVVAHSDSTYVLGGISRWILGWKRRGWTTAAGEPVKNEDLWRELDALCAGRGRGGVEWRWVRGHSGHDANERCDALAVARSKGRPVEHYEGPLLKYPHGSLAPSPHAPLPDMAKPSRSAEPAGPAAYLSLLDGRVERHETWKECEARVKGRSGARFKKVRGPAEEALLLRAWGVDRA
jgi:ribonuclease HI